MVCAYAVPDDDLVDMEILDDVDDRYNVGMQNIVSSVVMLDEPDADVHDDPFHVAIFFVRSCGLSFSCSTPADVNVA